MFSQAIENSTATPFSSLAVQKKRLPTFTHVVSVKLDDSNFFLVFQYLPNLLVKMMKEAARSVNFCKSCCLGNSHKTPFLSSNFVYNEPLQLVLSDLWGPASIKSQEGYNYYIHFTEANTRYSLFYLLKQKSDAFNAFLNFKANAELQHGVKLKGLSV